MMEKTALKSHETEKGRVIGACDAELLGKVFSEGAINLRIEEDFYFEEYAEHDDVLELVDGCLTANLVGKRIVESYCEKNPEAKRCVKTVGGIPHLHIFKL
jgi:hypothetical protein